MNGITRTIVAIVILASLGIGVAAATGFANQDPNGGGMATCGTFRAFESRYVFCRITVERN